MKKVLTILLIAILFIYADVSLATNCCKEEGQCTLPDGSCVNALDIGLCIRDDGSCGVELPEVHGKCLTFDDAICIAAGGCIRDDGSCGLEVEGKCLPFDEAKCKLEGGSWDGVKCNPPLVCFAIKLVYLDAKCFSPAVFLGWATASEIDNAGFNLYRARGKNGKFKKINVSLIPATGSPSQGVLYSYQDTTKRTGNFFYKLEDVDINGVGTMHDPIKVKVRARH